MINDDNHWYTAENFTELYEAIYFFKRFYDGKHEPLCPLTYTAAIEAAGIHKSVFEAVLKILVVGGLLEYEDNLYRSSPETLAMLQEIQEEVIKDDPNKLAGALFDKATDKNQFFFNGLSDLEYDIYSRCDFEVTYKLGREVGKIIGLKGARVLELGGNSGGLAAALIAENGNCDYTVVDLPIPCRVGRELNRQLSQNLRFIEANVFDLTLPEGRYDHMIAVNLLHDFDDAHCLEILKNSDCYASEKTKFTIVEDLLTGTFEPTSMIMHGLRLAVECRGGKQRTVLEMTELFAQIGYQLERTQPIDAVHTLLTFGKGL